MKRLWKILVSLRLTQYCSRWASSWCLSVRWRRRMRGFTARRRDTSDIGLSGVTFFGHRVPIALPGGYCSAQAAHQSSVRPHPRFQWDGKIGIHLTHTGVILLLVGQLATDLFSRETMLRLFGR